MDDEELTEIEECECEEPDIAEETAAVEVADEPAPPPAPKPRERMPGRRRCARCGR